MAIATASIRRAGSPRQVCFAQSLEVRSRSNSVPARLPLQWDKPWRSLARIKPDGPLPRVPRPHGGLAIPSHHRRGRGVAQTYLIARGPTPKRLPVKTLILLGESVIIPATFTAVNVLTIPATRSTTLPSFSPVSALSSQRLDAVLPLVLVTREPAGQRRHIDSCHAPTNG